MYNDCVANEELDVRMDRPREACGIFGAYSEDDSFEAATATFFGLYALQHRGQESAGMVISDGQQVTSHKDMGLVAQVFPEKVLQTLKGRIGIGHVRYSTTGSSLIANAQPLMVRCSRGMLAVAHNGNLVNTELLRQELERNGSVFQTSTDTEVIVSMIARHSEETLPAAVLKAGAALKGSFALVIMTKDTLIGIRDPYGVRPLCIGKLDNAYLIASESCALAANSAQFLRDVEPGEMVVINREGLRSFHLPQVERRAACVFEYIYFARPDSNIDGINVHLTRKAMGRELARLFTKDADVVSPVPDSGLSTALGFAEESGISYEIGLYKNQYVGRTFIQPKQSQRNLGVRIKLTPVEAVVRGKRVVIIDDSIVRGTTTGRIIRSLREAGAKEVHMCISSPPITHPCYYGIDTSVRKELIASSLSVEEIRKIIGADSLTYLTLEGLTRAVREQSQLCVACFSGEYPIPLPHEGKTDKYQLEGE